MCFVCSLELILGLLTCLMSSSAIAPLQGLSCGGAPQKRQACRSPTSLAHIRLGIHGCTRITPNVKGIFSIFRLQGRHSASIATYPRRAPRPCHDVATEGMSSNLQPARLDSRSTSAPGQVPLYRFLPICCRSCISDTTTPTSHHL